MKYLIILLLGLSVFSFSVQKQDNIGKAIFDNSCKSCHLPNKATKIAPSFQNIRKDYGIQWTLDFLKDSRKLMDKKDINALYSYYFFGKIEHTSFPVLESKYVIKILDYVDGFQVDTSQFRHRLISYLEKQKSVRHELLIDTVAKSKNIIYIDPPNYATDDSSYSEESKNRRIYNPKKKDN